MTPTDDILAVAVRKLASQHPEFRRHLLPILASHGDRTKQAYGDDKEEVVISSLILHEMTELASDYGGRVENDNSPYSKSFFSYPTTSGYQGRVVIRFPSRKNRDYVFDSVLVDMFKGRTSVGDGPHDKGHTYTWGDAAGLYRFRGEMILTSFDGPQTGKTRRFDLPDLRKLRGAQVPAAIKKLMKTIRAELDAARSPS